jgi:hypothetical protein
VAHPDQIGPYRILQVLGQGGMGVVYEAEQTSPVHRRVALKVLRPGFESAEIVARFDAERQALAVMMHESIAKVLDAGASDAGSPYFARRCCSSSARWPSGRRRSRPIIRSSPPPTTSSASRHGRPAGSRLPSGTSGSSSTCAVSGTIARGYVEMLRALGRNRDAAALEARVR